jgi:hypothetical protein
MPAKSADQNLFYVTLMKPRDITPEMLGVAPHVAQIQVFGRAPSRAAFARAVVAAGLDRRSPTALASYLAEYGGHTRNAADLAAMTDDRLYVRSINAAAGSPLIPYPLEPAQG